MASGSLVGRRSVRSGLDFARDVAVGHDDDHRLGFAVGDQIVQDHVGFAGPGPGSFDLTVAMQEVEHGILLRAGLVPRRRVDIEHARRLELLGIVEVHVDSSVADRPLFKNGLLVSRNDKHAGRAPAAQFQVRIRGVRHAQTAVDGVPVGVETRIQRAYRQAPDTLVVLLEGLWLLDGFENARRSHQDDFRRFGSVQAESDGTVRMHFRRNGNVVRVLVVGRGSAWNSRPGRLLAQA